MPRYSYVAATARDKHISACIHNIV